MQDFLWSDFTAKPDHRYTYEVVPVRGAPKNLKYDPGLAVDVTTESTEHQTHCVYFNRGVIGSQAYSREFGKPPNKLKGAIREKAYKWLSRGLEEAMLAFILQAKSKRYALRAAVYEFNWSPISDAFKQAFDACGDVRIIYDARIPGGKKGEDNKKRVDAARKQLRSHGLLDSKTGKGEAVAIPRKQSPSYIAHNKFIVLLENGKPVSVWIGSTNFTESGNRDSGRVQARNCGAPASPSLLAAGLIRLFIFTEPPPSGSFGKMRRCGMDRERAPRVPA